MGKGIFITGTDTGVGKTLVAGGIAAVVKGRGVDVGVMKPVETGCLWRDGRLAAQDALFLKEMAECRDEIDLINPYAFEEPLTPALAAERAGKEIDLAHLKLAFKTLMSRHELVLVEGAGGLLSPLWRDLAMADLARELGLSLLIISRGSLGTINHTLLALYYARKERMAVLGVVINHTSPQQGLAGSLNAEALQRWGKAPVLGEVPYVADLMRESIRQAIEENVDLERLIGSSE